MNKLLFLVPCFNEEHRFSLEYWQKLIENKNISFLFIDDGSTDKTAQIINSLKSDNVNTLLLHDNKGKSNAVRSGILKAYEDLSKYILIVDSDASFSINCLYDFISRFEFELKHETGGYQAYFGARVKLAGRQIKRNTSRHIYSRVLHTILGFMNRQLPYDTNCGLKILNLESINPVIFREPFKTRWFFEIEMLRRHKLFELCEMKVFDIPALDCVDQPTNNFDIKNRFYIIKEVLWLLRQN